jgi:hypothetical protein
MHPEKVFSFKDEGADEKNTHHFLQRFYHVILCSSHICGKD